MDHMGGMGNMGGAGYGYSIDTFLGGLLLLLVKLLMVALVIAVIIGVGVWIKNTFFKNTAATNTQFLQYINKDPVLKTVSVITLAVLGIILIFAILGSFTNPGMGYGMGGYHAMGGYGGFNAALSIRGLLDLLIKVLSFVLVLSLILALAAYIKKQYEQGVFNIAKTNALNVPDTVDNTQQSEDGTNKS